MFSFTNIDQYHQQLRNNTASCADAVAYYLEKINGNKKLNAFTEVFADEALQKAKELDEKRKRGEQLKKLHGVVIAIKDVICYKDHVVTASSKILEGFKS